MPKTLTHIAILDLVISKLEESDDPLEKGIGTIMRRYREYAIVGAIGPDLFFWGNDYLLSVIVKKVLDIYKELVEIYNETIGRVVEFIEMVGEPVERAFEEVMPTQIGYLELVLDHLKNALTLFAKLATQPLFLLAVEAANQIVETTQVPYDEYAHTKLNEMKEFVGGDYWIHMGHYLFDLLVPPLQLNKSEDEWYWFDMLHYRKTTEFAHNLIRNAPSFEAQAFAYGYITHIAADLVGHAYVNKIVGGPYRLHVQRHAAVENYIDTWVFREYYGGNIVTDLPNVLTMPDKLPQSIINQLYRSFIDTYQGQPHPHLINEDNDGFFTIKDIEEAYQLFKDVLEIIESSNFTKPDAPFDDVWEILEDGFEGLKPPSSPPRGGFCFSWDCIMDTFKYIGEMILWISSVGLKMIDLLVGIAASLPVTVILAVIYSIELSLYYILHNIRLVFVHTGFMYPSEDDLDEDIADRLIFPPDEERGYPLLHSHMECPSDLPNDKVENRSRYPGPYNSSHTPKTFIEELPFTENEEALLRMLAKSKSPSATDKMVMNRSVGNAVDIAIWMIKNMLKGDPDVIYANWNLDSDRGYCYREWRSDKVNIGENEIMDEYYID